MEIENRPITIEFDRQAKKDLNRLMLDKYEVVSLVVKMGERLLWLKSGEKFKIIDKEQWIGVVGYVNAISDDIVIDITAIVDGDNIYFSRGMKLFKLQDVVKWPA